MKLLHHNMFFHCCELTRWVSLSQLICTKIPGNQCFPVSETSGFLYFCANINWHTPICVNDKSNVPNEMLTCMKLNTTHKVDWMTRISYLQWTRVKRTLYCTNKIRRNVTAKSVWNVKINSWHSITRHLTYFAFRYICTREHYPPTHFLDIPCPYSTFSVSWQKYVKKLQFHLFVWKTTNNNNR